LENRKALNEIEKRKKLEVMVKSAKEESKLKNSFEIVKLKKEDREIFNRKSPCLYKLELDNINPDCAVSSAFKDAQNQKQDDDLLKKSNRVMNNSVNARRIIESVIEKIESNNILQLIKLDKNQNIVDELEFKKTINGFKLKAYTNLFKKGKNLDIEKVIKPKNNKRKITVHDLYDEIYLKEYSREGIKSTSRKQKLYLKNSMHKENQENSVFDINQIKSSSNKNRRLNSVKYFHPFLADD